MDCYSSIIVWGPETGARPRERSFLLLYPQTPLERGRFLCVNSAWWQSSLSSEWMRYEFVQRTRGIRSPDAGLWNAIDSLGRGTNPFLLKQVFLLRVVVMWHLSWQKSTKKRSPSKSAPATSPSSAEGQGDSSLCKHVTDFSHANFVLELWGEILTWWSGRQNVEWFECFDFACRTAPCCVKQIGTESSVRYGSVAHKWERITRSFRDRNIAINMWSARVQINFLINQSVFIMK